MDGASEEDLNELRLKVVKYQEGIRSPWLYVTSNSAEVNWLTDSSYRRSPIGTEGFLKEIADGINAKQPSDKKIGYLTAGDFRDALATYAFRESGGMILMVKNILGHKHLRSSQLYIDNNIVNEESAKQYLGFSNAFFSELIATGRVDPTIIAKVSRDGNITDIEREKLAEYRMLRLSRIGVGCKDPTNPPKKVDPGFVRNGKKMCTNHRCTLCIENAVIFKESMPGLAKRFAELNAIKASIPVGSFELSLFAEELENTAAALQLFDSDEVASAVSDWAAKIANGSHRVIDLDGN
jgi:hypothetical protein